MALGTESLILLHSGIDTQTVIYPEQTVRNLIPALALEMMNLNVY